MVLPMAAATAGPTNFMRMSLARYFTNTAVSRFRRIQPKTSDIRRYYCASSVAGSASVYALCVCGGNDRKGKAAGNNQTQKNQPRTFGTSIHIKTPI